ncbi:PDZ domain-containing protein [Aquisphaera insulae]|uniref:PDZ domain-containing protein n=1 Tax=Aquisphaera insulae TaxID=2712864 RepID=UPI0013EE2010|nr:PDZ domain-containing protein [Aquisphaera insulae]
MFSLRIACLAAAAAVALESCSAQAFQDPERSNLLGVRIIVAIDANSNLTGLETSEHRLGQFISILERTKARIHTTTIDREKVSPETIVSAIRQCTVNQNESLMFYYIGHGATDPNYGHFLSTHGEGQRRDLLRSRLRGEIVRKRAGLSIIVSDCCSSSGRAQIAVSPAPQVDGELFQTLEDLFLRSRGVVDITGASYFSQDGAGEFGWFHQHWGGLFTAGFCDAMCGGQVINRRILDNNQDGVVGWNEIFPVVVENTQRYFTRYKSDVIDGKVEMSPDSVRKIRAQDSQTPQAFSLGSSAALLSPKRSRFGAWLSDNYGFGVVILAITPGSPASRIDRLNGRVNNDNERWSFVPGDLILEANGQQIHEIRQLASIIDGLEPGSRLKLVGLDAGSRWREAFVAEVALP